MNAPSISRYRIETVEVPAPKDEDQIIQEALGLIPPLPAPGDSRRMLRITLQSEPNAFPTTETPFNLTIGNQQVDALEVSGDGGEASGLIEAMPVEGDAIALNFLVDGGETVVADHFHPDKADTAIA